MAHGWLFEYFSIYQLQFTGPSVNRHKLHLKHWQKDTSPVASSEQTASYQPRPTFSDTPREAEPRNPHQHSAIVDVHDQMLESVQPVLDSGVTGDIDVESIQA